MNHDNFSNWFENKLLKNLKEPSIIVMDNAPYHRKVIQTFPNTSWKKQEIKTWLQERNVPLHVNMLKPELLKIVSRNKPPKRYIIDSKADEYVHFVLRLPPYHCIFNQIENVWGKTIL